MMKCSTQNNMPHTCQYRFNVCLKLRAVLYLNVAYLHTYQTYMHTYKHTYEAPTTF